MDIVLDNRGKQGEDSDEMIPFFSIASRDFDKDLVILKFYINLSRVHIQKMHTNSVKEQHLLQVGGFTMYSLNVILYKGYFNYYRPITLHITKKLLH